MKTAKQRWAALSLALAGTLLAAYFAPSEGGEGVMLTAHAQQAASTAAPSASSAAVGHGEEGGKLLLSAIEQRDAAPQPDEPPSWTVMGGGTAPASTPMPTATPVARASAPPSEPASAPPPPPPQAPALPFKWLGWAHEDGHASAFLQYQDQNLVVKVGDRIDGRYSVERIDAQSLTFVYLPLNEVQTLNAGRDN